MTQAMSIERLVQWIRKHDRDNDQRKEVKKLKKKGFTNVAIANELGISESTVRRRLKEE